MPKARSNRSLGAITNDRNVQQVYAAFFSPLDLRRWHNVNRPRRRADPLPKSASVVPSVCHSPCAGYTYLRSSTKTGFVEAFRPAWTKSVTWRQPAICASFHSPVSLGTIRMSIVLKHRRNPTAVIQFQLAQLEGFKKHQLFHVSLSYTDSSIGRNHLTYGFSEALNRANIEFHFCFRTYAMHIL